MAKKNHIKKVLVVLISTFTLFIILSSQVKQDLTYESESLEIVINSKQELIGRHTVLDVEFSSVLEYEGFVVINITLRNGKLLEAHINHNDRTFYINFTSQKNGALAELTMDDLQNFHTLNSHLIQHFLNKRISRATDTLLRVLNLLDNYPPNQFFSFSSNDTTLQPIISLCNSIGDPLTATYDIGRRGWFTETEEVGPCHSDDSDDCIGRCGAGCGIPPHPLFKAFTLDCFIHDLCARKLKELGYAKFWMYVPFGPCGDEWLLAMDDFLFGPNCNEISGNWTIKLTGITRFGSKSVLISSTEVFYFQQGEITEENVDFGFPFKFTGVYKSRIDGRLAKYDGRLSEGNNVNGSWKFPTYMAECGWKFLGYASGTFDGKSQCNEIDMHLSGSWPWYYTKLCTRAGYGSFIGSVKAYRGTYGLSPPDIQPVIINEEAEIRPGNIDSFAEEIMNYLINKKSRVHIK